MTDKLPPVLPPVPPPVPPAVLPRVVVVPGDANGIGPELTAKFFASGPAGARLVLAGDEQVVRLGESQAGTALNLFPVGDDFAGVDDAPPDAVPFVARPALSAADIAPGTLSAECGRASLADVEFAAAAVARGIADGVLFAPLNKAAMKAGGMSAQDELHHLADKLGRRGPISEINILADGPWTSRVTSHIPLRAVADMIDGEKIVAAGILLAAALRDFGIAAPRVAVAALNPHAGDGGNFGREEIDIIAPAVSRLRDGGVDASGPFPADTLFVRAMDGAFDAVVTMYHDQGQIALKLAGFHRGVTVQGGLPVPVATPAHGTAFDIAGKGAANPGATFAAFEVVRRMAANRKKNRKGKTK